MFGSIGRAALRAGLRAGLAVGLLGIPLAFAGAGVALADPPPCDVTYTGAITGSIVVPGGTSACLHGATVSGGVTINPGGAADIEDSTITGAVASTGAVSGPETTALTICDSTLGSLSVANSRGDVLVGDGTDPECLGNTIRGAASFVNNRYSVNVAGNTVGGGLVVTGNSGEEVDLAANNAGGAIVCTGNSAPFDFPNEGPNTAKGGIVGQCVDLPSYVGGNDD